MNTSPRIALVAIACCSALLLTAMEPETALTPAQRQVFGNIVKRAGDLPHTRQSLSELSLCSKSWLNTAKSKNACAELIAITKKHLPYVTPVTVAIFFGTPGSIAWARECLEKQPKHREMLNNMLIDIGTWKTSPNACWPTQAVDVAQAILAVNNNPNYAKDGKTALMTAAEYGMQDLIELLVQHGADVNLQNPNDEGKTALMYAAQRIQSGAVQTLIKAKADPRIKNAKQKTALDKLKDIITEVKDECENILSLQTLAVILNIAEKVYERTAGL